MFIYTYYMPLNLEVSMYRMHSFPLFFTSRLTQFLFHLDQEEVIRFSVKVEDSL